MKKILGKRLILSIAVLFTASQGVVYAEAEKSVGSQPPSTRLTEAALAEVLVEAKQIALAPDADPLECIAALKQIQVGPPTWKPDRVLNQQTVAPFLLSAMRIPASEFKKFIESGEAAGKDPRLAFLEKNGVVLPKELTAESIASVVRENPLLGPDIRKLSKPELVIPLETESQEFIPKPSDTQLRNSLGVEGVGTTSDQQKQDQSGPASAATGGGTAAATDKGTTGGTTGTTGGTESKSEDGAGEGSSTGDGSTGDGSTGSDSGGSSGDGSDGGTVATDTGSTTDGGDTGGGDTGGGDTGGFSYFDDPGTGGDSDGGTDPGGDVGGSDSGGGPSDFTDPGNMGGRDPDPEAGPAPTSEPPVLSEPPPPPPVPEEQPTVSP